ncbi:hypothetical protein MYX84_04200 [Acidobacteria bacterium AH-259-O06]|nr:hypothetical protein [Acidobacteria bacterium AH-259-L09]MDA2929144.1 hypothetical protein [Acidobacteria bacterium AH-259-O06]
MEHFFAVQREKSADITAGPSEDGGFVAHLHGVLVVTPGGSEAVQALILKGRVNSWAEITLLENNSGPIS